ncbi:hypothetical protein SCUCBS95973_009210 [Sporothrix curviconia]|uniref:DUF1168 domain protein n=1 Tax=Sporothrix curviconia TaxID=1260050 RepID=A0ABP0CVD3_9PEZI
MSGEGPESVPTSADRRSKRPVKKRALTPVSAHAADLDALFAKPEQTIRIPESADVARVRGGAPPEVISNVQGSSSGAGSGEFHVYKASRRREYARLRQLDEEAAKDREAEDFEKEKREREARDDEKTKRNREKREKAKARKAKGKKSGGGGGGESAPVTAATATTSTKTKTKPTFSRPKDDDSEDEADDGNENGTASANGKSNGEGDQNGSASSIANGANKTAQVAEPISSAEGPGLLIQDDDD